MGRHALYCNFGGVSWSRVREMNEGALYKRYTLPRWRTASLEPGPLEDPSPIHFRWWEVKNPPATGAGGPGPLLEILWHLAGKLCWEKTSPALRHLNYKLQSNTKNPAACLSTHPWFHLALCGPDWCLCSKSEAHLNSQHPCLWARTAGKRSMFVSPPDPKT